MRRINYHFENSETGRYMALEIGEKQKPVWHHIEMISNNSDLGLTVPLFMEKEDKSFFSYKIESCISLAKYVEEKEIDAFDFCKFIRNILIKLSEAESYLLDKNCFILNSELIFVDHGLHDVSFIYFPCKTVTDINVELRELLSDLITSKLRFSSGGEFAIATLLNYYKSHNFNIYELGEVCEALIREKAPAELHALGNSNLGMRDFGMPNFEAQELLSSSSSHLPTSNINNIFDDKKVMCDKKEVNDKNTVSVKKETSSKKEGGDKKIFEEKGVVDNAMKIQPVFAVVAILLMITPISNYVNFLGPNPRPILFFMLAGLDLLAVFLLFLLNIGHIKLNRVATIIDKQENTILLTNIKVTFGYLVEKNIPNGIKFEMNTLIIVVGRDKDTADLYCNNMAVGKIHAQLHFHEGAYFVSDLSSKNGTFVNGARVEPNKEKKIKYGDEIYFANSGFVFEKNK